jgi:lipoate-protein ligase A
LLHKREGTAEELHHTVLPIERGVWLFTPTRPAIVLGSSQKDEDIDRTFCSANGIDVVRRRSGGGAVYVHPSESLWIDIVLPRGDVLWNDDIGKSMWWIGDWWVSLLASVGMTSTQVHRGAFERNDWSDLVCFAGRGSGEVFPHEEHAQQKVVGISQRRTRDYARFQCIAYYQWNAELHAAMLPGLTHDVERIATLATPVPTTLGAADLAFPGTVK